MNLAFVFTFLASCFSFGTTKDVKNSFFDYSVKNVLKQDHDLAQYKGKVVLVVNVASKCGFTPQYEGLEELYKKYGSQGLVVLGFPCNQFKNQEPGTNEEIQAFCKTNYGITFPILDKVEVNGANTAPVYKFLKAKAPGIMGTEDVKWNFTKFLVGKDGQVLNRYAPTTEPKSIAKDIEGALKK